MKKLLQKLFSLRRKLGYVDIEESEISRSKQVVYLDFDGANTLYNGSSMTIGSVAVAESGFSSDEIAFAVKALNDRYDGEVIFVSEAPVGGDYSTVFIGGTDTFSAHGDFLGLAETIDVGNQIKNDNAFVITNPNSSIESVISIAAHEVNHIVFGLDHGGDGLNAYAATSLSLGTWGDQESYSGTIGSDFEYNEVNIYIGGLLQNSTVSAGGSVFAEAGALNNVTLKATWGWENIQLAGSGVAADALTIDTGLLYVRNNVNISNLTLKVNGIMSIDNANGIANLSGTNMLSGKIQTSAGTVSLNDGSNLIFDFAGRIVQEFTIIDDFAKVTVGNGVSFSVNVDLNQQAGDYKIAGNASTFGYNITLTINDVNYGVLTVNGVSTNYNNRAYSLVRNGAGDLYLNVAMEYYLVTCYKDNELEATKTNESNKTIGTLGDYDKLIAGKGGAISNITVTAGGVVEVYGGTAGNLTIDNGGSVDISGNGSKVTGSIINAGGLQKVAGGGQSAGVVLTGEKLEGDYQYNVAELIVNAGGTVDGGTLNDYSFLAINGGKATGITLDDKGDTATAAWPPRRSIYINGGTLENSTLNSGITYIHNGGNITGSTINGGSLELWGNGSLDVKDNTINGGVFTFVGITSEDGNGFGIGDTMSNTTITGGKVELFGGIIIGMTVGAGGSIISTSEASRSWSYLSNIMIDGGKIVLYNATTRNITSQNGGNLTVYAGSKAFDTFVNAGGELYVQADGYLERATVNEGGRFGVYAGGIVKDVTLNKGYVAIYAGAELQGTTRLAGTLATYVPENNSADKVATIHRLEFIPGTGNDVMIDNVDQVNLRIKAYDYTDVDNQVTYKVSMLINDNGTLTFNNQGTCLLEGTVLNDPSPGVSAAGDFHMLNNGKFTIASTAVGNSTDGKYSSFINSGDGVFDIVNAEAGDFTIESIRNTGNGLVKIANINKMTMNGRVIEVEGISYHTVALLNTGSGNVDIANGGIITIEIPLHVTDPGVAQWVGYIKDINLYDQQEIRNESGELTGHKYTSKTVNRDSELVMSGGIHSGIGSTGNISITNYGLLKLESHGLGTDNTINYEDKRASIVNFGSGNIAIKNYGDFNTYGIRNDGSSSLTIENTDKFKIQARQLSAEVVEFDSFNWANAGFDDTEKVFYLDRMKPYLSGEYIAITNIGKKTTGASVEITNHQNADLDMNGGIISVSTGHVNIFNGGRVVIGNSDFYNKAAIYNDLSGNISLLGHNGVNGEYIIYGGIVNNSDNGSINIGGLNYVVNGEVIEISSSSYTKNTIYGNIINNGSGDILLGLAAGSQVFASDISNNAGRVIIDMKGDAAVYGNVSGGTITVFGGRIFGTVFGTDDASGGTAVNLNGTSTDSIVGTVGSISKGVSIGLSFATIYKNIYAGAVGGNKTIGDKVLINSRDSNLLSDVYVGNFDGGKIGEAAMRMVGGKIGGNVYGGGKNAAVEFNPSVYGNGNVTLAFVSTDLSGKLYGAGDTVQVGGEVNIEISNTGVSGAIYGGGINSTVAGSVTISVTNEQKLIDGETAPAARVGGTVISGNIYGAGQGSTVSGNVNILIQPSTIRGDVFGGGLDCTVNGNINIGFSGIDYTYNIYGGGSQSGVAGNVDITVENSTINGKFCGGGLNGDVAGTVTLKINSTNTASAARIYGGGAGNIGTVSDQINTRGATSPVIDISVLSGTHGAMIYAGTLSDASSTGAKTVYGDVKLSATGADTIFNGVIQGGSANNNTGSVSTITGRSIITLTDVTVNNYVYGGGNNVGNGSVVNAGGVKMTFNNVSFKAGQLIAGGGRASGGSAVVGTDGDNTTGVNIVFDGRLDTNAVDIYGGGITGGGVVTVYGGVSITVKIGMVGSVYAGGWGTASAGSSDKSNVYGGSTITITGGTITGGIYLGGRAGTLVHGDSTLTLANAGMSFAGTVSGAGVTDGKTKLEFASTYSGNFEGTISRIDTLSFVGDAMVTVTAKQNLSNVNNWDFDLIGRSTSDVVLNWLSGSNDFFGDSMKLNVDTEDLATDWKLISGSVDLSKGWSYEEGVSGFSSIMLNNLISLDWDQATGTYMSASDGWTLSLNENKTEMILSKSTIA